MRRYLIAATIVLVLHAALTWFGESYRNLLYTVGGWFVYGREIGDLFKILLAGFVCVGAVLVAGALGIVYATRETNG